MDVAWTAIDPESGDLAATETRSDADGFMSRLQHLLLAGEGYTEVRRVEVDYPLLTFSFRGNYGVMHLFESPDDCRLLRGDGGLPATRNIDVPVLDGDRTFSGDFVMSVARARAAITAFIEGAPAERLGEWVRL
ncbi:hypothetical protein GA0070607_2157 [Micromonospora coriariae]|uniref:Immunity protein Imm1 n=1 Tax=Micromonospora coriariae TaxID=285665 RepID=A0A1C4VHV2_9ACTN|nr:hypothetical protein [Micromonospora coriariae]SCE83577.1 hypothetical protein GA0070607_2157 [Micromonospora coriariae]